MNKETLPTLVRNILLVVIVMLYIVTASADTADCNEHSRSHPAFCAIQGVLWLPIALVNL